MVKNSRFAQLYHNEEKVSQVSQKRRKLGKTIRQNFFLTKHVNEVVSIKICAGTVLQ